MSGLRWVWRRRRMILAGLGLLTIGYGVLIAVVPWRFCKTEGYVLVSVAIITLMALELAEIRVRRDR